ncbi:hypothetical protein ACLKA6_010656 [Drosophila palustris]
MCTNLQRKTHKARGNCGTGREQRQSIRQNCGKQAQTDADTRELTTLEHGKHFGSSNKQQARESSTAEAAADHCEYGYTHKVLFASLWGESEHWHQRPANVTRWWMPVLKVEMEEEAGHDN